MNKRCLAITVRTLKVITYIVSFAIVLAGSVMSKGTILFMTSQIRPHKTILYCNKDLERDKQYQAEISTPEQVTFFVCLSCLFVYLCLCHFCIFVFSSSVFLFIWSSGLQAH
jgi:chitin synthase